jgi:serine/threonine-protein kinase
MARTLLDGRYELLRNVASGGMGTVYEALHIGTGQRVAIKVVTSWDGDDSETVIRFQREAKAAGSIDTPHIVRALDAGKDRFSGIPFIAMEYLEGCDLNRVVTELGPVETDLALRIAAQACAGLDKAHAAGIVHRDVKPANLFLALDDADGVVVKLLDFGIAKLPERLLSSLARHAVTTTGKLLGSPQFMSPEQAKGLRTIDHRTDVWSVGAVLYTMLAGFPPFEEFETVGQIIVAICSAPPSDLTRVAPHVPAEVAAVVHRALRMNPADRYASAKELHDALCALLPRGVRIARDELFGTESPLVLPVLPQIGAASEQATWVGERARVDVLQHLQPLPGSETQAITPREAEDAVSQTLRSGAPPASRAGTGKLRRKRAALLVAATAAATVILVSVLWAGQKRAHDSELTRTRESARAARLEHFAKSEREAKPAMPPLPSARAIAALATAQPNSAATSPRSAVPRVPRPAPLKRSDRSGLERSSAGGPGTLPAALSAEQPSTAASAAPATPSGVVGEGSASFSTLDKNFE